MTAPVDPHDNPWTTRTNEVVYDNPWIRLTHRHVITPTGTDGIYGHIHFKKLAVSIIPLDGDHTWLVGQYRYAPDCWSWELPAGGGSLTGDPVDTARRELREECGLTAGRVEELCRGHLSNSVTDERYIVYLATDLRTCTAEPDDTELLTLRRVPIDDAIAMARRGEITHSLSTIALLTLALERAERA